MSAQTETLDRLYLEWSQFTTARTAREIALLEELEYAAEIIEQECGESSSSATRARAAIAKAKEQGK